MIIIIFFFWFCLIFFFFASNFEKVDVFCYSQLKASEITISERTERNIPYFRIFACWKLNRKQQCLKH